MRQDPAFKDIFAYGFMAEELMRWFVGDLNGARALVDALDFSRLLRVQEQSTTGRAGDKRSYANDIVWRVPFRGRVVDGDDRAWLHLVLMIEVQGEVDHLMALRVRNYVDNHHMELWRGRRFGAADRLAPVLLIVIYTGPSRWTAAPRACRRGRAACSPATSISRLSPLQTHRIRRRTLWSVEIGQILQAIRRPVRCADRVVPSLARDRPSIGRWTRSSQFSRRQLVHGQREDAEHQWHSSLA